MAPRNKAPHLLITEAKHRKVKSRAAEQGVSMNEWLNNLIDNGLAGKPNSHQYHCEKCGYEDECLNG